MTTRRPILTDKMVAALPKKETRYRYSDPQMDGHVIRVMPEGPNIFFAVARTPGGRAGKQIWHKIGDSDVTTIAAARDEARAVIKRIRSGLPAVAEVPLKPDSFQSVAESWLRQHVRKRKLITAPKIEWCLKKYVYPHWAHLEFVGLKRSHLATLQDVVETSHGERSADTVAEVVRSISKWFMGRNDDYASPFVGIERRHLDAEGKRPKRSRTLADNELRKVWKQSDQSGPFGALIQTLILCGQRRGAVLGMKWSDLSDDGVWSIPRNPREKINAGSLKLPQMVLDIIRTQPRYASNPFVFAASRGDGPMNGFSRAKKNFDKACGVSGWTLHDLRRCSRSLLSRCGVRPDIAERTLGHVVGGTIGQTYDRFEYANEKADALKRLATLVDMIVNDRQAKVVQIGGRT